MYSLAINVYCVGDTRIQDSSSAIQLIAPNILSRYFLRTSENEAAGVVRQHGVVIVLTEAASPDWILDNIPLRAIELQGAIAVVRYLNAQVEKLSTSEARLGRCYALLDQCTDKELGLLCFMQAISYFSTDFRRSSHRTTLWCSNSPGTFSEIDHTVVSYRWFGSIQTGRPIYA